MAIQDLEFFVYDAHEKIFQLYRQLPEARFVMIKHSATRSTHNNSDLHIPPPKPPKPRLKEGEILREPEEPPFIPHVSTDGSETRYNEALMDKNEMYQRRRILQHLRQSGQLRRACPGARFYPGGFYELEGLFYAHEPPAGRSGRAEELVVEREAAGLWEEERIASVPEGAIWINSPESERCPAVQLLCARGNFCGALGEHAWREYFCCGALPLRGVAVCFQPACGVLVGLPLFLTLNADC
ncbi:MAG: hypothetical protein LBG83_05420 [Oscillospiraceae bacterium]|jgi:hypothetical protein|nr:hypothetical protein [Oscillospiraceae bacterium]